MDNFFTDLNPKFFNVFTTNREINYDLLSIINNNIETNINNTASRDEILNWIISYLSNKSINILISDEEEEIENIDYKTYASDKIRYFVKTGWLSQEEDSNFNITYMVDENAIMLLKAMSEITKSRTSQTELYGLVYQIYSSVKNFSIDQSVGITEQIVASTKELVSRLRGVNNIVKKYLSSLLSNPYLTPAEILEKLLVDYNDKVVLKTLTNLREHDNPLIYKNEIKEKLEFILEVNEDRLSELYIRDKLNSRNTIENRMEAISFFKDSFNYVIDTFENIDELISILNKNNSKYVSNAKARTNFLLNDSTKIDGVINNILKNIEEFDFTKLIDVDDNPFNLYDLGNIDEYSLYKPRVKSKPVTSQDLVENNEINQEKLEELALNYFKDNEYSSFAINKYVLDSMKDKKKIESKDLISCSLEIDSLKQFLVLLYSTNKSVGYKIDYDVEFGKFIRFNQEFDNFIIERK